MNVEEATEAVGNMLALVVGFLFLMGAIAAAVGFVAGVSLLSWGFVTWAYGFIS